MRRALLAGLLVTIGVAGVGAHGQGQAPAALPTVDQVLEKYVAGLGGRAAIEKLRTRYWKGTLELPDGSIAALNYYAKAPNKRRYTIDVQGMILAEQSFNGTAGWSNNSQDGVRDLDASEMPAERLLADFYSPLNIRKSYAELTLKGRETVRGSEAYVVEGKQPDGRPRVMYFDVKTGLMVRFVIQRDSPEGVVTTDNYLEDYRPVDGVMVPHLQRQESPEFVVITRLTEVRHNLPVEDSFFEKPKN